MPLHMRMFFARCARGRDAIEDADAMDRASIADVAALTCNLKALNRRDMAAVCSVRKARITTTYPQHAAAVARLDCNAAALRSLDALQRLQQPPVTQSDRVAIRTASISLLDGGCDAGVRALVLDILNDSRSLE